MATPKNKKGKNFSWLGGSYAIAMDQHLERNLDRAALTAVTGIKKTMRGSGFSGTRSGASKSSRAREARGRTGEPPRVQTGRLRNSIGSVKNKPLHRLVGANVGAGVGGSASERGYAYILEFLGHRKGWRPFLRPYVRDHSKQLQDIITAPMPKKTLR